MTIILTSIFLGIGFFIILNFFIIFLFGISIGDVSDRTFNISFIIAEIIAVAISVWSAIGSYNQRVEHDAQKEYLSHMKTLKIEIPNITSCEGTVSGNKVLCDNGTTYNNAVYIIRDTIWDNR